MQLRWLAAVLILLLWCSNRATATHIYGGQLSYNHLTGNDYRITLTLYGDCSATNSAYLRGKTPQIWLYKGQQRLQEVFLKEDTLQRAEVTPICKEYINNTACKKPGSMLPGAMRHVYTSIVTFSPSTDWRIVFEGNLSLDLSSPGRQAGRSDNITNVSDVGAQLMFLEARLNNNSGNNSTPLFSSDPTPFFCLNKHQQYNQGAIDTDGDSLVFALTPALINSTQTVSYVTSYSGATPISAYTGSFSFNPTNGQLSFQPDIVQRSLVVNKIEEYKDGILVGSSMREMTFIVLNDCNNTPPRGIVDSTSVVGGAVKDYTINVCSNTPELKFRINSIDDDNDNVTIAINNIPSGATATVDNTQPGRPQVNFSWNTQNVALGNYNFFITYTDDACPLYSSQTIAYTVNVVAPMEITHDVIQPTNCIFRQHVAINISNGIIPRKVTIKNNLGTILGEYLDTTGTVIDSFKPGSYTVFAEAEALQCKAQYTFNVEHYGTYPIPPLVTGDVNHCIGDMAEPLLVTPTINNATIYWYDIEGTRTQMAPTYSTERPAVYKWFVSQQAGVCESATDTVTVTVHDYPDIRILNTAEKVCVGDGLYLQADGGVKYEWQPKDKVEYVNNAPYTYIRQATTYAVTGFDQHGCSSTDSISYSDIEQCCTFSYPTAFTPNNDGINDGWHPVTYGNMDFYLLSVYNRWGQRVYVSSDPHEHWDGSFNGKACEMDTYHYFLRAKCVTGGEEETKGSFILLK